MEKFGNEVWNFFFYSFFTSTFKVFGFMIFKGNLTNFFVLYFHLGIQFKTLSRFNLSTSKFYFIKIREFLSWHHIRKTPNKNFLCFGSIPNDCNFMILCNITKNRSQGYKRQIKLDVLSKKGRNRFTWVLADIKCTTLSTTKMTITVKQEKLLL